MKAVRPEIIASNPRFARRKAKLAGETRYFSGRPCKYGHLCDRWTSSAACAECMKARPTYLQQHPEYTKAYRASRPAWTKLQKEKRRAAEKAPAWASDICIIAIYRIMRSLRRDGVNVSVDHVVPLRGKKVSGLHVRENLQIIPFSANCKKHASFVL